MFQLSLPASLEVLNRAIRGESGRIPKPDRFLHTKLVLEGTQKEKRCSWPSHPRRFRSSHPDQSCF